MEIIISSQAIEGPYTPIRSKRFHAWEYDYRLYTTLDAARSAAKSVANRCRCPVWIHKLAGGPFTLARHNMNSRSLCTYIAGVGVTNKPPRGIPERCEALARTAGGREGNDEKGAG